jgi:hypothetical protein
LHPQTAEIVFPQRNSFASAHKKLASAPSIHASLTISKNYGFNIPAGGTFLVCASAGAVDSAFNIPVLAPSTGWQPELKADQTWLQQ